MKLNMDRFTLSANTLSRKVKDNRADRIEVEIGDSKQLDFKPQFKIKRWDNEVNFSMRAVEEPGATMVEEDGKVKYKGKDIDVHQYEKPDAGEDGGFEFEWVLNKKPKSNVLRTTIQHKGLDFFYQPALTAEEIKQGNVRDENVVGSYAVYHSTKRNNIVGGMEYQTGKAFHIYRPHAVDADGVKVWCELDIKEGELTVTVPQDFLNTAVYPVVVDPTFGYTSVGASSISLVGNNFCSATEATSPGSFAIDSITVHAGANNGTPRLGKAGVYTSSGNFDLIDGVTGDEITLTATSGWLTSSFVTKPDVSDSVTYMLGILFKGTGLTGSISGDFGSPNKTFFDTSNNFDVPQSWGTRSTGANSQISIYATYTAASSYNPAFAHRRLLL